MVNANESDEDARLRSFVVRCCPTATIDAIIVERGAESQITLTIQTHDPAPIIGWRGQRLAEVQRALQEKSGRTIRLQVFNIFSGLHETLPPADS